MTKINERTTEYLNSEHTRLEEWKKQEKCDTVLCEIIQDEMDEISSVIQERRLRVQEILDDERTGFNDVSVGNISI